MKPRKVGSPQFHIIYISVNAIRPGVRSRTKDAIGTVRHLFLEADEDGSGVLARVRARADVAKPSYVLESSPNRIHIFWRVRGFTGEAIEQLQKQLASELHTDTAATACSQTTRLPGYRNHKRNPAHLVRVEYGASDVRHTPAEFPTPPAPLVIRCGLHPLPGNTSDLMKRARRYLTRVDPAIAGQHGDVHTFKVCCRLVRGFALTDEDALTVLTEWNTRCEPPWRERELRDKISRARKYGREPFGGLRP